MEIDLGPDPHINSPWCRPKISYIAFIMVWDEEEVIRHYISYCKEEVERFTSSLKNEKYIVISCTGILGGKLKL